MQEEINTKELKELLDQGKPLYVLDVRNSKDFAKSKIEGNQGFIIENAPYMEIVEKGGGNDFKNSLQEYASRSLKLPRESLIVTVCNRGNSSLVVSSALRELNYSSTSLKGGMKGWGEFYDSKLIVETDRLKIFQISRPSRGCLSYYINSSGEGLFIDPARHIQNYLSLAQQNGNNTRYVFDTHCHADHISGAKALATNLKCDYLLHPYDGIHPLDGLPATFQYRPLWDGQEYPLGKISIKVIHIPGHTLGNSGFLIDNQYLFVGDSIFLTSIARPDLGGHAETWTPIYYRSLNKLLALPNTLNVLPAHFHSMKEQNQKGYFGSSIEELRNKNEGLKMAQKSEKEFMEYILKSLPIFPKEYIDIKRINLGLLNVNEDQAAELELGKNICALGGLSKSECH